MGKIRGFSFKHRVRTLFRRVFRRRCRCFPAAYSRQEGDRLNPLSSVLSWSHHLGTKAVSMLWKNVGSARGYIRARQEPVLEKPGPIPKGHIAVYVGQRDGDFQRILVPVVYVNHPLFGDLLKESEKEYGFNHPGGITIPCRISEFERIRTRIKAVQYARKLLPWR